MKLKVEQYETGKCSNTPVSVFHWEVKLVHTKIISALSQSSYLLIHSFLALAWGITDEIKIFKIYSEAMN